MLKNDFVYTFQGKQKKYRQKTDKLTYFRLVECITNLHQLRNWTQIAAENSHINVEIIRTRHLVKQRSQ